MHVNFGQVSSTNITNITLTHCSAYHAYSIRHGATFSSDAGCVMLCGYLLRSSHSFWSAE
eukprot:m.301235 g.301235  ORF g.301235 m.301235 type:complete len:60 (+) comp15878_c2_seq1:986-1165(+)